MNTSILSILALASIAAAQPVEHQPPSLAGVVRLNRAPVSNEVVRVQLPRPVERPLANGVKLLVVESHRVPQVTLQIRTPAGDLRDPSGLPGLAQATSALLRQGTRTRSSKAIAESLAELSASLNISTVPDSGIIILNAPTETLDQALEILSDVLLNASFPREEFEKWKARQRVLLEQRKASPGALADDLLFERLYGMDGRRYTHPTTESLERMTRDDVVHFFQTWYLPSGCWAGVAGDIAPAAAVAKLNTALADWKGGPVKPLELSLPSPVPEKKVYLIPRPNSVQTYLVVANHALGHTSPDYIASQVLNRALGSGPASRLFRVLREEKGYTYSIGSAFNATRVLNHFTVTTSVRTEVTGPALDSLLQQLRDIREKPIPRDELADVKSALVSSFVLGLENPYTVLGRWIEQRIYGLPEDYWDTYSQKVLAVTSESLMEVAKKYIPLENAQIIAVGDPAAVANQLKPFGPVETPSLEGQPHTAIAGKGEQYE